MGNQSNDTSWLSPVNITLIYIIVGFVWIFTSDQLALALSPELLDLAHFQTVKGFFFILATGILLYFLVKSYSSSLLSKKEEIRSLSGEVHHRVKNNLALITGLLELEQDERDLDSKYVEMLIQTNFKIKTIAIIHEILYQQNSFSKIDLNKFLEEFKEQVINPMYGEHPIDISFRFNRDKLDIDIKHAIPLALFLYECFVYSKHYQSDKIERIVLTFYKSQTLFYFSLHFIISGSGEYKLDFKNPTTLELQLASVLLRQLNTEPTVESDEHETAVYCKVPLTE